MGARLVLKNEGNRFEKLYYQAICLGELSAAERLYAQYTQSHGATFWRDAFRASALPETVLMSAIINLMNIPFGSYVFERLEDDVIQIAPWLYADEASRQALLDAVTGETDSAQAMRAHARTLNRTADFLEWLEDYYKKESGRTEATHG